MILPVSPEISYWYATRLCEFANLKLRRDSWRSLFFSDVQDDAYERFKNAIRCETKKALRTFLKLRASRLFGETLERFLPPSKKTFAAVQRLQKEIRDSLQKVSVAVQRVRSEA